ncbi:hypothetical protein QTP70_012324 [Hemibagrus guttatus]|uniref:Uncharacterized protein n=1 Tax=Hemibagrus guttatus TaxID=175788 RepID=A0AAE0UHR9_9TELE|nr:hypothetical protein QTP70_012324 [Hemibagrus guttatus]
MRRLEEGHMEGGADVVRRREPKQIRHQIDLADDLEGADELGAEFAAGQLETQVPGGQPDLLPHLIGGVRASTPVGLDPLPPYCPLQSHMGPFPDLLT